MSPNDPQFGVLLVVHGTRDRRGVAEALRALTMIGERVAPRPVELGFIELAEPDIGSAVERLVQRGVRRLTVAPLMLLAADHVKQDIPRMIGTALSGSDIESVYAQPLDTHPLVLETSARRLAEQVGGSEVADALVLLVGRGSGDPEAIARFEEFARLRRLSTSAAEIRTCYLAAAHPRFEQAVEEAGLARQHRVVVQPHLLFQGRLMQQLEVDVAAAQSRDRSRKWLLCRHLGPDELIVDAVLARLAEAETSHGPCRT
ncbi:MAG: sirohydrochlorin chelatase [Pirellulales bacterium]